LETYKNTRSQLQVSLLRRRGSVELLEKVGMSNTGDGIINQKAEVLPEAYGEGTPKGKKEEEG
jgi:hypothetical protein